MRAATAVFAVALCATLALGQVTLPGVRRPEPAKPADPTPTNPATPATEHPPTAPPVIIPPNVPGNLPPVTATTPLSDDLLTVESAGLTMNLPAGSVLLQGANNDGTVYSIVAEDRTWTIEVQVRQTSNANSTVHDAAALVTRNVEQLAPTIRPGHGDAIPVKHGSNVELLQRLTQFSIAGCASPGERLYFAIPAPGNTRQIMGYTILKPMPTTFVLFQLTCDESQLDRARAAYEVCIATARLEDPTKAIAARAASLAAGTEFLSQLNEEKLAKLGDSKERWFRWYMPTTSGAGAGGADRDGTEIGYRILKVSRGRRSDIGAEGGGGRDNPPGLVVVTQVRMLQRGAGGIGKPILQIDSDTKAFTSFDRKDEAWVTTTISRDLKDPAAKSNTFSETGVRSGNSMAISSRTQGKGDSVVQPTLRSAQYLSVGETPLLGTLLVLDTLATSAKDSAGAARELGFYAYRADAGTISLRRETIFQDPKRGDAWTVRSRSRDEKATTLSVFRNDGSLVRTELADGSVWEPVEPEALLKVWRSKNLPVN